MKPPIIHKLKDHLSKEELKEVESHKEVARTFPVTEEWLLIAEWVKLTGLAGYLAYKNDSVTFHEMMKIIEANRVLEAHRMFEDAQASLIGAASAQTKRPDSTFKMMIKDILKRTKVDD